MECHVALSGFCYSEIIGLPFSKFQLTDGFLLGNKSNLFSADLDDSNSSENTQLPCIQICGIYPYPLKQDNTIKSMDDIVSDIPNHIRQKVVGWYSFRSKIPENKSLVSMKERLVHINLKKKFSQVFPLIYGVFECLRLSSGDNKSSNGALTVETAFYQLNDQFTPFEVPFSVVNLKQTGNMRYSHQSPNVFDKSFGNSARLMTTYNSRSVYCHESLIKSARIMHEMSSEKIKATRETIKDQLNDIYTIIDNLHVAEEKPLDQSSLLTVKNESNASDDSQQLIDFNVINNSESPEF